MYLRDTGRPSMMGPADLARARARIRTLQSRGMSYMAISRASGLADSTLVYVMGPNQRITRRIFDAVMSVQFEPPPPELRGARLPIHGAQRRLQAMYAEGFTLADIGRMILGPTGRTDRHHLTMTGQAKHIHYRMFQQIAELYDKLDGVTPQELGLDPHGIGKALNLSAKRRYPPRGCWDADTIDDPDAHPEWTGVCGTVSGPGVHKREKIPLCRACLEVKYEQRRELLERRKGEQAE